MAISTVQLWVDYEPFCFGVIQAHTKLSKVYLKKVMTYARSKGADGGYPRLSWGVWRHMAMNKMLFPESSAWAYFSGYNAIRDATREERLDEAELMQQSYESKDVDGYKNKLHVNTTEFVLHLFLQQSSKTTLRTSLVGEEWPRSSPRSRSLSPDGADSPKLSNIPSILEEGSRLSFILSNLTDLIEILAEPDQASDHSKMDRRLSVEAVRALGYVIKAYVPKTESLVPLHSVAMRHRFQNKSGYSRSTNDFSCRTFENWVRSSLMSSPFSTSAMLESGTTLPWMVASRKKKMIMKRCRILLTSLSGYHNTILFLHCSQQTIGQQLPLLKGSSVKLVKCNYAHFYLLSPLRSISIEKCHDTTFVFGPVSKCIRVSGCNNITIISPCRSIIISTSNAVTAHIAVPSQPIIIGENSSKKLGAADSLPMVTLAPYHTFYDKLEQHLADIGLVISPQIDQWNNPFTHLSSLSRSRSSSAGAKLPRSSHSFDHIKEKGVLHHILPASEFFSFVIPFKSSQKLPEKDCSLTTSIPWGLPEEYAQSLKERQASVERYQFAVKNADMTKAEKRKFQSHMEGKFKEWLEKSGDKRQLDDLIDLTKAYGESSTRSN